MKYISFYKPTDAYGEFSNFSDYPIEINGFLWPTVEHFFQAYKFAGTAHEQEIRLLKTPMEAKIAGCDRNKPLRSDWEKIKNEIMYKAVYEKFSQHPEIKNILLLTGNSTLIENTPYDSYWGSGKNEKGRNMLGQILMMVRDDLKSNSRINNS